MVGMNLLIRWRFDGRAFRALQTFAKIGTGDVRVPITSTLQRAHRAKFPMLSMVTRRGKYFVSSPVTPVVAGALGLSYPRGYMAGRPVHIWLG